MKPLVLCLALAGAVAFISPAKAQQNFMDSLKGAIGSVTGEGSSSSLGGTAGAHSLEDISGGLREALRVGVGRVVGQVG